MAEGGSKLSEEQICEYLRMFNVPVRMNDIKYPNREFIVRVFECFLRDLQIDITHPEMRPWESTNHIEDGDIYEDAQLLILLAMSVNHITDQMLSITVKDIVEPKPKRTKKILNYLLVFWNYYIQKYARFRDVEESFEGEKKRVENLVVENESLDEKYNDMLKTLKSMMPKEELSNIVKIKEEKAAKLQAECDTLGSNYQALKTKEVNIRNQMGALDVEIITAKENLEELCQCILTSPERISGEIKKLQDRIKTDDGKIKEWENNSKEAMKKLELEEKSLKEREVILSTLDETNEIVKNLRGTVISVVDLNEKVMEEEEKIKRLLLELERKEDLKDQQIQKRAKIVLNSKKQIETLKDILKTHQSNEMKLKKEAESLKFSIESLQENINLLDDKIINVIEELKKADARSKEREAEFREKLNEMRSSFASDCKEITDLIRKTFA